MRADQVRDALTDPNYEVPPVSAAVPPGGIGWLRATVARFSTGDAHHRRRELAIGLLSTIDPDVLRQLAHDRAGATPVDVLSEALGVAASTETVAEVAAAYHPHFPAGPAADAAVAALVDACGGVPDESTAARIGLLVQAHAATTALVERARGRSDDPDTAVARAIAEDPPVVGTRRVRAGETVELDLRDLPFGAGPHACPGRAHAIAIACGLLSGRSSR